MVCSTFTQSKKKRFNICLYLTTLYHSNIKHLHILKTDLPNSLNCRWLSARAKCTLATTTFITLDNFTFTNNLLWLFTQILMVDYAVKLAFLYWSIKIYKSNRSFQWMKNIANSESEASVLPSKAIENAFNLLRLKY